MKKIYAIICLALGSGLLFGQSQRLILVEECTQASCPPCASQNPAFNALLSNNVSKVTSIKYQVSWPGVDPMNAQNPTDVATRVSYYSVTGVPDGNMDGTEIPNDCGAYVGAPACLSQSKIDAEYAITSPFSIALSHSLSTDYDSVFINCVITASSAFTSSGALKAHIVLVEKDIIFTTAPGTNGEKDFSNVMRKMYPSASGTTLSSSWTASQSFTITVSAAIPSYVYDLSQIAVVAFVQDDGNKSVKQAAYSAPQPIIDDAGISAITSVPTYLCTATSITPGVTIKNYGSNTVTSCTINYKVDNGTVSTLPWTGSLASGQTATVNLPSISITGNGTHTFYAYTSIPNSNTDYNTKNDTTKALTSGTSSTPVNEGFSPSTAAIASSWAINDPDGDGTWKKKTGSTGGFGWSSGCIYMPFYSLSNVGNYDEINSPAFSMSTVTSPQYLSFAVAYAQYDASAPENDQLDVYVSTDCGINWTNLYSKAGDNLKTASPSTPSFVPTASQWRKESIDLSSYVGQANVLLKFKGTTDYGNNLYIDDIQVTSSPTRIEETIQEHGFSVFPNPFTDEATIVFNLEQANHVSMEIYNLLGDKLFINDNGLLKEGKHTILFNSGDLSPGVYLLKLKTGNNIAINKIVIQ